MRVFVTGATSFVGSAVVQELLGAGHQVLGLACSEAAAKALRAVGAEVQPGTLADRDGWRRGVEAADGVIHTAGQPDLANCQVNVNALADWTAVKSLGAMLAGSDRPLVVSSTLDVLAPGRLAQESDQPATGSAAFHSASERAADAVAAGGVRVSVVRLPPAVHGPGAGGFVPALIQLARTTGVSVYPGAGDNHWPAVHRLDVARLFRLALEQAPAPGTRLHGVAEEGVAFRALAEAIGQRLRLPVVSQPAEAAAAHFGWLAPFAALDLRASSQQTQQRLGWCPERPGLLADLVGDTCFSR